MNDYLLEIGVEEIPAAYINSAEEQFKNMFVDLLNEYELNFDEIVAYNTPRRLTVIVKNLDEEQKESKIEIKGPSAKIAFDENGKPSKALSGFMKSQNVTENEIDVKDGYVYASTISPSKSVFEIFEEELPKLIKSINFPKNMKWGGKEIRFARPIRWLVSVYGDKVLKFDLEGIVAGNVSRGHRVLGESQIVINSPEEYKEKMLENYVIVDPKERREKIRSESMRLAREISGELDEDEDLLEELTNINEYPTAILGSIRQEFLDLPNIVITTTMKAHLRFLPVYKDKENLLPSFISIVNGTDEHKDVVIEGNEKVLGARLSDAKFFYETDLNTDFEELKDKLKRVVYHEKLGTMDLKVERIKQIAEKLGGQLFIADEAMTQLLRAAEISKTDLLTQMVNEFTELQGIMGEIYALKNGEDTLVAKAVREQYLPRFNGDELPDSTVGSILAIAEKMDGICGMFAIGNKPTGSQDPFGLRRSALGIINIIRENKWNFSVKELIKMALYTFVEKNNLVFDYESVSDDIYKFFLSRIRVILLEEGIRYDLADAVLCGDDENIYNIFKKADELKKWFEDEDRSDIVETFKRLNNIAVKADSKSFSEDLFNEFEKSLISTFNGIKDEIENGDGKSDYIRSLNLLTGLVSPINEYLDNVLVFVDDENIKNNRLGLLKYVNDYLVEIIDFSKIVD